MSLAAQFAQELEHESVATRKCLAACSEQHFGFQPHPKSMTLGQLASHIAESPGWGTLTLNSSTMSFDGYKPTVLNSTAEVLAAFDKNLAACLAALRKASDADLAGKWTATKDGKTVIDMPRAAIVRGFVLSHIVHHRGQLSVYMRLCNIPVPSIYGPTADTPAM